MGQMEGQCSSIGCTKPAVWTRKHGWTVAPGSPEGDVCNTHHCWEVKPTAAELLAAQAVALEYGNDWNELPEEYRRQFLRDARIALDVLNSMPEESP